MRQYKTGTEWCAWRWSEVDSEYITRFHLIKTPWFAVCLHWIKKPDPEPYMHDHPVSFLSIILRGHYRELRARADGHFIETHRWWNWIKASASDNHTIQYVSPGGCLTLCFMGPKTRSWGFRTQYGWVWWRDYYAFQRAGVQL